MVLVWRVHCFTCFHGRWTFFGEYLFLPICFSRSGTIFFSDYLVLYAGVNPKNLKSLWCFLVLLLWHLKELDKLSMSQVLHSVCSAFFKTLQTINAYALPNLCQEVTSCAAYIGLCNIKPETIRKDQKYNFKIKKNCRRTICNWNEKIKSSNLSRFNDGYIMVRQTNIYSYQFVLVGLGQSSSVIILSYMLG